MEPFVVVFASVAICTLYGWFGRMDGGGKPSTPEIVDRLLCISCFVWATIPFAGWFSIITLLGIFGLATGHGQYFLARMLKALTPEFFDFVVRWFFKDDWRCGFPEKYEFSPSQAEFYQREIFPKLYKRNVFGMFVTGMIVGLPAAILSVFFGEWLAAFLFLQTGTAKALAYVVGYKIWGNTESAEFINGFLRTLLAVIAFWNVI